MNEKVLLTEKTFEKATPHLHFPNIAEAVNPGYESLRNFLGKRSAYYSLMEVIIVQRLSSFML